ncbi:MAG: glycosyl hydrolase [Bacteroidales bacterium]|nr:glycosyl hydrolase [Bacteroidales bacterium]
MRILYIFLLGIFTLGPVYSQCTIPDSTILKIAGDIVNRDYFLYENKKGIHYAEIFTASASLATADLMKNGNLKSALINRYKGMLVDSSKFITERSHVDHNVQAVLPFTIYKYTGDKAYLNQGLKFANRQWERLGPEGLTDQARWWVDDMYMIGILQLTAYRITGEKIYIERASNMIAAYLPKLQQANGLFLHGPSAPFHWCRGNGWVASILAEILADLPVSDPNYNAILTGYKRMMEALLKYQSDNGMWRQLIDYKYSWTESSGTAMFAFAMTRGVNLGILMVKIMKMLLILLLKQ